MINLACVREHLSSQSVQQGYRLLDLLENNSNKRNHFLVGFVFQVYLQGSPLFSITGVFLRWNRSSKCLDEAYEEMVHIIEYNKELQNKVNSLRRQLAQLETEDPLLQTP